MSFSITHAVHVYQPGNIPAHAENTERAQYSVYGDRYSGVAFGNAFIHDEPLDQDQEQWLEEHLYTRIAPGGVVRLMAGPSPMSGPKVSVR